MASRREEQQRRRAERMAAEKQADDAARRRLLAGYFVAGLMGFAVVVGLVIVLISSGGDSNDPGSSGCGEAHIQLNTGSTNDVEPDCREGTAPASIQTGDLEAAAQAANCELMLDLPDEGNTHIGNPGDKNLKVPDYETNPPTSGDHISPPHMEADGAYAVMPAPELTLHSLEHGRINIQYSSDLSEDDQLALKGVFDESPEGMLIFPNDDMPYEVAATAWTQMLGCEAFEGDATLDAIRDFRDIYRGQGPEDVPLVTG